jgi:hypothetical protein
MNFLLYKEDRWGNFEIISDKKPVIFKAFFRGPGGLSAVENRIE